VLGVAWLACQVIPYLEASRQYENLVKQSPRTRADLEPLLRWYTSREIKIQESLWGQSMYPSLPPSHVCVQYNILGANPIDVVYNEDEEVVDVISSFE